MLHYQLPSRPRSNFTFGCGCSVIGYSCLLIDYRAAISFLSQAIQRRQQLPEAALEDLNQTNQSVFKLPRLNFEENIKAIKKNNLYRKEVDQIIAEADKFYDNTFNILGSGWIKWENHGKIAWHTDIKSNYTFKKLYYKSMKREIKKELFRFV